MTTKFSVQNLIPIQTKYESRDAAEPSTLTIVNTSKNGKRVVLSEELLETIGSPEKIQISLIENGIAICEQFSKAGTFYRLRPTGKKRCVYSAALVDLLTDDLQLDFNGRTSLSFREVEYISEDVELPIAFVPITIGDNSASPDDESDE
ncbi:hypothetical protein [Cohnella fermenti]|uniref:Uncharacterized protein n=1 Tax=Cohnella fermenti TaxID=2565925 RepID=A0A4S4BKB6_9BACL|nr:hypothetical protein [Cohnella fermenti]THF72483.1 hypothetical protein E6C55_32975 [Cohnella fermenti]